MRIVQCCNAPHVRRWCSIRTHTHTDTNNASSPAATPLCGTDVDRAAVITTRLPNTRCGVGMYKTIGIRTELAYATEMLCTLRKTDRHEVHARNTTAVALPGRAPTISPTCDSEGPMARSQAYVRQSKARAAEVIAFAAPTTTYPRPVTVVTDRSQCLCLSQFCFDYSEIGAFTSAH